MEVKEQLNELYEELRAAGAVHTRKELAAAIGVFYNSLTAAMNGDKRYCTASLLKKVKQFADSYYNNNSTITLDTVPILPVAARAGVMSDFSEAVQMYQCEQVVSPIRGASFAIQITGDSMEPQFENGSLAFIKQVDERSFIEWGKVYVLDTPNGAVIKRIQPKDEDSVICESINEKYHPFCVRKDFIRGWYRVLAVLSYK